MYNVYNSSSQLVNSHLVCDPTIRQAGLTSFATVVTTEPFLHGTGTLQCLKKEMATCRHWSVSLRRDSDDVPHCRCRILSSDKTEWRLILAALCQDGVSWLTNYGSLHTYEKKKT